MSFLIRWANGAAPRLFPQLAAGRKPLFGFEMPDLEGKGFDSIRRRDFRWWARLTETQKSFFPPLPHPVFDHTLRAAGASQSLASLPPQKILGGRAAFHPLYPHPVRGRGAGVREENSVAQTCFAGGLRRFRA